MSKLLADLDLKFFAQHDNGSVLHLTDHDKRPATIRVADLHGGAQRLAGGMGALVAAIASSLPPDAIHLEQELVSIRDLGAHVELLFRCGETTTIVRARQAVLAIPPRLLDERVRFEPALDEAMRAALQATPTWMADKAKVVVTYEQAFWRAAGESGNAFVSHEQVVLGEIFDACDADGEHAALGGFFALSPQFRASTHPTIMPMLISSQLVQVFGPQAEHGEQHMQDWATEPFTCSTLDMTPTDGHPEYGHPQLRRALWNNKLFFGGSETAGYGGGYMEGALEAAARIQRALALDVGAAQPSNGNADCLAQFSAQVAALRAIAIERYRQHLQRYLAAQTKEQLTQRALLDSVEQVYSEALDHLGALPFDTAAVGVQLGRSDLTPSVLATFEGFNSALLEEVVQFNRGSCAISNFPNEHDPAKDYVDTIARDLAAAWREFAINVNGVLLSKGKAQVAVLDT
jgi:monoamine oxidase